MITIIDYGLGNLASVSNALGKLNVPCAVSSDIRVINDAEALILPGVGAASEGMDNLKTSGIDKAIIDKSGNGTPILGICLGMQLMFAYSEEGNVNCLGLIEGKVKKFNSGVKIPLIGWNQIESKPDSILLKGVKNNSYFYFINSYYCDPDDKSIEKGKTEYGKYFCSVLEKDNLFGVQFHPEKSGVPGFSVLKNFINYYT